MADKLKIPKFASENDEADWWFEHGEEVSKAFEEAAADGTLRTGLVARLAREEYGTTIRLEPDDVSRAKLLAAQSGLRYQTYLERLVHEALATEEKKLR